jgi:hypothetical protein
MTCTRSTSGPSPGTQRLGILLEAQCALMTELEALAARQRELSAHDDLEPLLQLLDRRGVVIDRLTALLHEIEPLRTSWESQGRPESSIIGSLLDQIARRAAAVAAADRDDQRELSRRRGELSRQMGEVATSRRAVGAYSSGPAPGPSAMFQDREA